MCLGFLLSSPFNWEFGILCLLEGVLKRESGRHKGNGLCI